MTKASMRPRVFPAEDVGVRTVQRARRGASMRPRVFPAEDSGSNPAMARTARYASMRPRVFPAEDGGEAKVALKLALKLQ